MPDHAERIFVVDRIEEGVAVLVDDNLNEVAVHLDQFKTHPSETAVLRVPILGSVPDWSAAVPDAKERHRRLSVAKGKLTQLEKNDPGGDLIL